MFERLFGDRRGDPALADRVPPGQYVTEKFPVSTTAPCREWTSRPGTSRSTVRWTTRSS